MEREKGITRRWKFVAEHRGCPICFSQMTLCCSLRRRGNSLKKSWVIYTYERATGKCINPAKCNTLFGPPCSVEEQEKVRAILCIGTVTFKEKYLGLPTPEGRMSRGKFQNLQARLMKRIIAGGDTSLSQGRKPWLKQLLKPFQLISWVSSSYLCLFVITWTEWYETSGGVRRKARGKLIGWHGQKI